MTWTDLICAYITVACLWGDRALTWRDKWVERDKAGEVFWGHRL